ncbi:ferredoxin-type protein NapF [Paracoccus sp. WLY502]|uniref:ferredoxin-type protein NapF n=1 Tax=Paracoccus yibinensis TaxID=3068891 RepID=UPI002796716E|nr:ferredoxin-type protein NapF [Paracoccus sp. WLY502]MDQ1902590.1 ferredoxin-type protein NapF [Paracoccus sp. WLY502]
MPASPGISRRNLLRGMARPAPFLPRPPGVSVASLAACTGCGACVDACPQAILALAPGGVVLRPEAGECVFCGDCAASCPEEVFLPGGPMGHVMQISADCFVHAGIACMSCRDACPEQAIAMQPRIGAPFLPRIDTASCTGCAACSASCPADAIMAVKRETEEREVEDA